MKTGFVLFRYFRGGLPDFGLPGRWDNPRSAAPWRPFDRVAHTTQGTS